MIDESEKPPAADEDCEMHLRTLLPISKVKNELPRPTTVLVHQLQHQYTMTFSIYGTRRAQLICSVEHWHQIIQQVLLPNGQSRLFVSVFQKQGEAAKTETVLCRNYNLQRRKWGESTEGGGLLMGARCLFPVSYWQLMTAIVPEPQPSDYFCNHDNKVPRTLMK